MRGRRTATVARFGRTPVVLGCLLLALVLVHGISTIPGVRSHDVRSPLFDEWIQCGGYVLCGVIAVIGSRRVRIDRSAAMTLAGAIVLRGAGFVLSLFWVLKQPVPAYPSIADAAWIVSSVLLVLTIALRLRRALPRLSVVLVLDALAVSLLVGGISIEAVFSALTGLAPAGAPDDVIATNLSYPLLDIAIMVMVAGMLSALGWRLLPADRVLLGGVTAFAFIDVVFLYQVSTGSFRPGEPIASLSLVATAAMAASLYVDRRDYSSVNRPRVDVMGTVISSLTGLVAILFLVYDDLVDVPLVAVLMVSTSLVVVFVRGVATLLGDRAESGVILQATSEELLRFQALVETSSDFIAIAGMDGMVMYVNPAGRELVGLEPGRDVRTTTIVDYLTEEGIKASLEIEQPAVVAHGRWEGESTLRDMRGGPPIPVAISSFLMMHPETGEPFALATVQRDITERLAAQRELEELARQRQTLLSRLVQAQEDERARISADVHDDSVQALAAVDLRLGLLRRRLAEAGSDQVENVDKALATVRNATTRLRHLLFDLESPAQHNNLADALTAAADFVFEDTGIAWALTGDREIDLTPTARVTAYRIAKEIMVNARKHSSAERVEVGLARGDDGVLITIADDGVGMVTDPMRRRRGHRGLASVRDRATIAGGWLRFEGAPDEGTRVSLWLPDDAVAQEDDDEAE